jgi:hypothetical protein
MFMLKCLLLNIEHFLVHVPKALDCLERILSHTYVAAERTWSYSKHIARYRYPARLLARRPDLQKTQLPILLRVGLYL